MKTIVCLGDSIVEGEGDELNLGGWVGRLAQRLGPHRGKRFDGFRVFNLGISGETISEIFHRVGEVIPRKPDVVILGAGSNDVAMWLQDTRQPHPEYRVAKVESEEDWHAVLSVLTKICPKVLVYGRHLLPDGDMTADRATRRVDMEAHNAFIEAACKTWGAVFVPAEDVWGMPENLSHSCHPNARGYDAMAAYLHAQLKQLGWL